MPPSPTLETDIITPRPNGVVAPTASVLLLSSPIFHIKGKLHVVNGSRKLGIWRGLILSTSTQGRTLCQ
ncbi:unnamed protein product [Linum tenue]|uniref:Uncharacterized protein n=1 Tax=Linum tenue TaxID=586396 RepID=A0AAV0Q5H8_9ROSI|nr:unnamed protein product [Linum tenue]